MSVKEYVNQFGGKVKDRVKEMRRMIIACLPDAEEVMRYGIPTYRVREKNVVHFGGFVHHLGFYPGPKTIQAFISELTPYQHAKGSVQFPHSDPLLKELIKRMIAYSLNNTL